MKSSDRTVIHLHLLKDDTHHYFGSLASLCNHYDSKQIGIGHGALRNYRLTSSKPYKNSKCIIRKGILLSKEGGRGVKPKLEPNEEKKDNIQS